MRKRTASDTVVVPYDNKYLRSIIGREIAEDSESKSSVLVDVYDVLLAFNVTCPARQHAIKKLLMAGRRGEKTELEDLSEVLISVRRAIDLLPERNIE